MTRTKNKEQQKTGPSSTGEDPLSDSEAATPIAIPLTPEQQAFQLASANKLEIENLKKEISNPEWLKDFIISVSGILIFVKIILAIFFIILLLCLIVFIFITYFRLNHLILILEAVKESKITEINQGFLGGFNDFYNYARETIQIYLYFAIGVGVIAALGTFILKLAEYIISLNHKHKL